MIKLELTTKEAVMLAGILGVTEGTSLNNLYYELLRGIRTCDNEAFKEEEGVKFMTMLVEDITNLTQEEIHVQDDPHINEDYLYDEARKLNGLLD